MKTKQLTADDLRRWRCDHLPGYLGKGRVTQREAGDRVGVTKTTWHRWENGWNISKPYGRLILQAMSATGFRP